MLSVLPATDLSGAKHHRVIRVTLAVSDPRHALPVLPREGSADCRGQGGHRRRRRRTWRNRGARARLALPGQAGDLLIDLSSLRLAEPEMHPRLRTAAVDGHHVQP